MRKLADTLVHVVLVSGMVVGLTACDDDYQPPVPEPRLQIGGASWETVEGSAVQYSAIWLPESGSSRVVTQAAQWSSSDAEVAEFSAEVAGKLMTKTYGKVKITASYSDEKADAWLLVRPALAAVEISPLSHEVAVSARQAFVATGIYRDKSKRDLTGDVTWESSNALIAQFVGAGQVEGRHEGTGEVLATLGGITGKATLTVQPATATQPVLDPDRATLEVVKCGEDVFVPSVAFALIRQTIPDGAIGSIDVTAHATWSSSDETLAEVSGDGVVRPVITEEEDDEGNPIIIIPEGEVTITAEFHDVAGPPIEREATVEIVKKTVDSLGSMSVTQSSVLLGTQALLTLVAKQPEAEGGDEFDMTSYVDWFSSNLRAALFAAPGVVATWGPGSTQIDAELVCAGKEDEDPFVYESENSISLEVFERAESITVTQATSGALLVGQSRQFTARANFDGFTQDITSEATWECVDDGGERSAVAAMDNSAQSAGSATGTAVGACDVVATFDGVVSDPVRLQVVEP